MEKDSKKPCTPVEPENRDSTTVFREDDPLCAALDELCAMLNCWYAAMNNPWQRKDETYRRQLAKAVKGSLKRVLACEDVPVE